jgi:ABC-type uncharacterized transport system permease subunit
MDCVTAVRASVVSRPSQRQDTELLLLLLLLLLFVCLWPRRLNRLTPQQLVMCVRALGRLDVKAV